MVHLQRVAARYGDRQQYTPSRPRHDTTHGVNGPMSFKAASTVVVIGPLKWITEGGVASSTIGAKKLYAGFATVISTSESLDVMNASCVAPSVFFPEPASISGAPLMDAVMRDAGVGITRVGFRRRYSSERQTSHESNRYPTPHRPTATTRGHGRLRRSDRCDAGRGF